jgi:hypothetical protein
MSRSLSRRRFVARTLTAAAAAGLGDFTFLNGLPAVAAAEARATPRVVQFDPDIEPLVRLIEDTPREKLMETAAAEVRRGTSYQQLLGAVFLAGVRGIQPRPVGFKFHAVLVINSAHLASLAAADNDRWLPLFWALDNFKKSQADNRAQGGWMMAPVDESKLPPGPAARQRFIEAMDNWDEEGTDRAITALARTASPGEVSELLWRYGARDFRDIGHKAIYAANAWRTLQAIGWHHAEPVLRSLAYAMLEHEGDNPAKRDAVPDRPYRENLKRVADIGPLSRQERKTDPGAAADLTAALRTATASEGSAMVAELLKKGIHPASVWDGLFLTAGELLARQPGIVGLHCMTSANALHFASQMTSDDETRRLLMLQAAAFLTLFRDFMKGGKGGLAEVRLDKLEKLEPKGDTAAAVAEVFADATTDRLRAARKTLGLVEGRPDAMPSLMAAARRLVFSKGRDSHDYKFSSAALEDYYNLTPAWRARYAAAAMFNLKGSGAPDNDLIKRVRGALA